MFRKIWNLITIEDLNYQKKKYWYGVIQQPEGTSKTFDIREGFTSFWLTFYNGDLWENISGSIPKPKHLAKR